VAWAVLVLAASCTGAPHGSGQPGVSDSGPPTPPRNASSQPSPKVVVSDRVILTADLSEAPSRWRSVFFLPFGSRSSELGFKLFHESVNSQPSSFAVATDGSFWIADRWKDRLAHYSPEGRFLGAARVGPPPDGESIGRNRGRIRDIVVSEDVMYALFEPSGGPIARIEADGIVRIFRPQLEGRSLWVAEIFPSRGPLVMLVGGYVEPGSGLVADGPTDFYRWEPSQLMPPEPLPGLPSGRDSTIQLERVSSSSATDQDFELRFTTQGGTFVQPFHVEVRTNAPAGRPLPAEVGPGNMLGVGGDVLMYVMLTPSRPHDARRFGGGRWLLRMGRSPVLWERLPSPGISDEPQSRHLALGPDGAIYLMVAEKRGMLILRRR
jgi:hypothetical protein